jgi:hypothetical protein
MTKILTFALTKYTLDIYISFQQSLQYHIHHYDVPSGGLTCKITRGSFFAVRGLTASLSDADAEIDGLPDIGTGICICAPLPGLLATSGVLLFLESFLRSRRVLDVGGTQPREGCGGVRWTSR